MKTSHSEWYQSLEADKKAAIRRLHKIDPRWNLVAVLFIAMWMAMAWLMTEFPYWYIRGFGYVFIGLLIHGLGNFMHEGIHGNLFRSRRWNRWFGFLMGAPTMFPITAYGVNHLLHHKHTRGEDDPDEMMNVCRDKRLLSLFFYVWLLFGSLMFSMRVPFVTQTRGTRKDRLSALAERFIITFSACMLFYLGYRYEFLGAIMQCWIIPLVVAGFLGNIRGWAEHQLTTTGHPLTHTRTVTSSRLYSFFNINLNYHLEHHLFPAVPWYNLPKVHHLLAAEYKAAAAPIYSGYVAFLIDAFRVGIHGKAPLERSR